MSQYGGNYISTQKETSNTFAVLSIVDRILALENIPYLLVMDEDEL
jgi:hypothetical protein